MPKARAVVWQWVPTFNFKEGVPPWAFSPTPIPVTRAPNEGGVGVAVGRPLGTWINVWV